MRVEEVFADLLSKGVFRVDPDGAVWRLNVFSRTGRLLDIVPRRAEVAAARGYRAIRMGQRSILAHRAVYLALVGPLRPDQELNHRNGRRADNHPDNLEIETRSGNCLHSYRVLGRRKLYGETNGSHKLTRAKVDLIIPLKGKRSSRSVAKDFGVGKTTILEIWAEKLWVGTPTERTEYQP